MLRAKSRTYWEEAQVPHRNRYCLCDGSNNNKYPCVVYLYDFYYLIICNYILQSTTIFYLVLPRSPLPTGSSASPLSVVRWLPYHEHLYM